MTDAEFKRQLKAIEKTMHERAHVEAAVEIVKRGRGRPPTTGRGTKRGTVLRLALSPEERAHAERMAGELKVTPAAWARRKLFG